MIRVLMLVLIGIFLLWVLVQEGTFKKGGEK